MLGTALSMTKFGSSVFINPVFEELNLPERTTNIARCVVITWSILPKSSPWKDTPSFACEGEVWGIFVSLNSGLCCASATAGLCAISYYIWPRYNGNQLHSEPAKSIPCLSAPLRRQAIRNNDIFHARWTEYCLQKIISQLPVPGHAKESLKMTYW